MFSMNDSWPDLSKEFLGECCKFGLNSIVSPTCALDGHAVSGRSKVRVRMGNVVLKDVPIIFGSLVANILSSESVLAFHVSTVKVVKDQTADFYDLILMLHLKGLDTPIQKRKADRCQEFRADWHKDVPAAVVGGVRQNRVGWRAVDN